MNKQWRTWLGPLISVLVSGVFLYMAFRRADIASIGQSILLLKPIPVVNAMMLGLASNLVRAVRWGLLFEKGSTSRLGYSRYLRFLYTSMMIGYLVNNILPARLGELARVYEFSRKTGISKSTSLATIVLERVLDALFLLVLVGLFSFFIPLPTTIGQGSLLAAAIFILIFLGITVLAWPNNAVIKLVYRMLSLFPKHLEESLGGFTNRFTQGFSALRTHRGFPQIIVLTMVIWGLEGLSVMLIMKAMNVSLPFIAPLFLLIVLSLSFVIPAAPGGIGSYEFFTILALTPFGVQHDLALSLALVLHAIVYLWTSAQGLICLWVENLSLKQLVGRKYEA